jgi:chromate transporter
MSPGFPPAAVPELDISTPVPSSQPGLMVLFLAFAKMSLAGFGGAAWAGEASSTSTLDDGRAVQRDRCAISLPGPNIVNLSVVFGSRFGGIAGGIAAPGALLGFAGVI